MHSQREKDLMASSILLRFIMWLLLALLVIGGLSTIEILPEEEGVHTKRVSNNKFMKYTVEEHITIPVGKQEEKP